jgi:hypothetical protein
MMDSTSPAADTQQPPIVFRGKKRKTYRQRTGTEDEAPTATLDPVSDAPNTTNIQALTPDAIAITADEQQDDALSVSEALRLRNGRKSRLRGVTFGLDSNTKTGGAEEYDDELSLMIREEEKKAIEQSMLAANKRFAPQTGLSGEIVNKHM